MRLSIVLAGVVLVLAAPGSTGKLARVDAGRLASGGGEHRRIETADDRVRGGAANLTIIAPRHYARVEVQSDGPRPIPADISKATADELRAVWGPFVAEAGTYEFHRRRRRDDEAHRLEEPRGHGARRLHRLRLQAAGRHDLADPAEEPERAVRQRPSRSNWCASSRAARVSARDDHEIIAYSLGSLSRVTANSGKNGAANFAASSRDVSLMLKPLPPTDKFTMPETVPAEIYAADFEVVNWDVFPTAPEKEMNRNGFHPHFAVSLSCCCGIPRRPVRWPPATSEPVAKRSVRPRGDLHRDSPARISRAGVRRASA